MAIWFVSRHQGAIAWAKDQGFEIDHWVTHLDMEKINAGDVVIGTLPVHMAAEICLRGARFFFLELTLQQDQRGKELSLNEMKNAKCRIREYLIQSVN